MHDLSTVAIYGACFVAAALVVLAAGVAIAKFTMGPESWSYDEPCPEWVATTPEFENSVSAWTPCPHRRPCPLHETERSNHAR